MPRAAELRGLPRLAVVALVAAGLLLAVPGGLGLIFYVTFASVGAILAIRRPRTAIGWLLLAVAAGFAFLTYPVDSTGEAFRTGTARPIDVAIAVLSTVASGGTFLLLAVLAMIFPTGRLPGGRAGAAARAAILIGLAMTVLATFSPEISISVVGGTTTVRVPNPVAVLPELPLWSVINIDTAFFPLLLILAASAGSLAVRFARSTGVERQQLRWLGAALVLSVLAILLGFVIGALVPGSADSGLAWVPAMASFPTIPISIVVAVLRYRLYEIDTLINRAIVYTLVTAVLAGGSAAVIGIVERLFADVLGPGSEVTVIITTLVVVSTFDPIKKRISSVVDRRFKETPGPKATLAAFRDELHRSLGTLNPDQVGRRLAEDLAAAYRATGVEVRIRVGAVGERVQRFGTLDGDSTLRASASGSRAAVAAAIHGGYGSTELDALEPGLERIVAELDAVTA